MTAASPRVRPSSRRRRSTMVSSSAFSLALLVAASSSAAAEASIRPPNLSSGLFGVGRRRV
eukprot:CAMPEP_0197456814 /NCGR_PEP_ID=MMETSP1175-20131217/44331_1 /TAXON_ID=1003142 /ORGANISM="Triceratium dubium, Strain CCMP147" /LENGTH=60 /DNA_ID=CAMNT_0042990987 /DNA_START=22 /DNA_END=200 /DNA_ORIENTATION=+